MRIRSWNQKEEKKKNERENDKIVKERMIKL